MNSSPEFSDELLRRLPQKLQFRPPPSSAFRRGLLTLPYFLVLGYGAYWLSSGGLSSFWVVTLICLFSLIPVLFWVIFDAFIDPLVLSRGWYPCIEYLPLDRQLIITDLTGIESIFRADAQTILHLESLKSILVTHHPEEKGWIIALRTRKGELIWIRSSCRDSKAEVCSFAANLSSIVGHPVEVSDESCPS